MDPKKAQEIAYQMLAVFLPASWMQVKCNRLGDYKTSPKAVRLCNAIAAELAKAYETGATAERTRGVEKRV